MDTNELNQRKIIALEDIAAYLADIARSLDSIACRHGHDAGNGGGGTGGPPATT